MIEMNRATRRKCKNTYEMAARIENNANSKYEQYYEKKYKEDLSNAIDNFILTIVYTLRYNQYTRFGNKRINDFMEDLFVTIDMFRTGEYKPEEYRKELEEDGIKIISKKGD